jgi:hypothetical protein
MWESDMTDRTELALNHSDCLRAQENIGETVIHNICTGATHIVPWGSMEWLQNLGLLFVMASLVFLAVMVFALIIKVVTE